MGPRIPPMPNKPSPLGKSGISRGNETQTVVLKDGYGTIKQSTLARNIFLNFIENLTQAFALPQNLGGRTTLSVA
ncbi:MAG: hypothetical protein HRT47_12350 [Candidatus Caenarcaniphilales bacterium]|nr:hypothetical protein [Candidatus Caenarcaniphilales bacterium]